MSSPSSAIPEMSKSRRYSTVRFAWDSANKAPRTQETGRPPPLALSAPARLLVVGESAVPVAASLFVRNQSSVPRPPRLLFPSFPDAVDTDGGNDALAVKLGINSARLGLISPVAKWFGCRVGAPCDKPHQFPNEERPGRPVSGSALKINFRMRGRPRCSKFKTTLGFESRKGKKVDGLIDLTAAGPKGIVSVPGCIHVYIRIFNVSDAAVRFSVDGKRMRVSPRKVIDP